MEASTLSKESEMWEKRTAGGERVYFKQEGVEEDEKRKTNEMNKRSRERIKYWESNIVLLGVIIF